MIRDKQPLNIYETVEVLEDIKETDKTKDSAVFIKKFSKITTERAKKIKAAIENLKLDKLKSSDIVKIIDILPEDAIELNKIFTEIILDADETNKILDTIKQNK